MGEGAPEGVKCVDLVGGQRHHHATKEVQGTAEELGSGGGADQLEDYSDLVDGDEVEERCSPYGLLGSVHSLVCRNTGLGVTLGDDPCVPDKGLEARHVVLGDWRSGVDMHSYPLPILVRPRSAHPTKPMALSARGIESAAGHPAQKGVASGSTSLRVFLARQIVLRSALTNRPEAPSSLPRIRAWSVQTAGDRHPVT